MTDNSYIMASFDWTAQVDNLAAAVNSLAEASYYKGFSLQAEAEVNELIKAISRLREQWCPSPVEQNGIGR